MNRTIGKLWTDPLTISPCLVGDNGVELDYLFPVRTLHETPEDVSVCSSGQKEIIDLAFREAGMRCLGLSTHPILFDEWGVRMDETHKQKTAVLLSELTEQTRHDQIVMVSHQNVVHDSLTDIRRLVLCDKNIVIDGEYNDHVLIEK
jgi:ABC-type Mn2+/Zn2+ transport system ATPase subunit